MFKHSKYESKVLKFQEFLLIVKVKCQVDWAEASTEEKQRQEC